MTQPMTQADTQADTRVPHGYEVPPGWMLVPIEPTPSMLSAARWALARWLEAEGNPQGRVACDLKHTIRWRAMIRAAGQV